MNAPQVDASKFAHVAIVGVVLLCVSGCGGQYDASVKGVAKFNNAPLPSGTVKFSPQGQGPSGYALINGDGTYSVMTGREEGLPSGSYTVTVVANEPSIPNKDPSFPPTPGKAITPAWYRDAAHSPLKVTVAPGSNDVPLELTTQPPAGWKPAGRR